MRAGVGVERAGFEFKLDEEEEEERAATATTSAQPKPTPTRSESVPHLPAKSSTSPMQHLQHLSERFMAAHVGTERAGFRFEPGVDETAVGEGGVRPAWLEKLLQRRHSTEVKVETAGSSPRGSSRTANVWDSTFHPGGHHYQGRSRFDDDPEAVEGKASGNSVPEWYARKRSFDYVKPHRDEFD